MDQKEEAVETGPISIPVYANYSNYAAQAQLTISLSRSARVVAIQLLILTMFYDFVQSSFILVISVLRRMFCYNTRISIFLSIL